MQSEHRLFLKHGSVPEAYRRNSQIQVIRSGTQHTATVPSYSGEKKQRQARHLVNTTRSFMLVDSVRWSVMRDVYAVSR